MRQITVSQLYTYPVKALGGIELSEATALKGGLKYDRNWLIVDKDNQQITQREHPKLTLLQTEMYEAQLRIKAKHNENFSFSIPIDTEEKDRVEVRVWGDLCSGYHVSHEADQFFSEYLRVPCRFIKLPQKPDRMVSKFKQVYNIPFSYADGYPYLLISLGSLELLNSKLAQPVEMARFRPNLVITGCRGHEEDALENFRAGGASFKAVKPCGRCVVTTIDLRNGTKGVEPLKTLSKYRKVGTTINFGMNLICLEEGEVKVGDKLWF